MTMVVEMMITTITSSALLAGRQGAPLQAALHGAPSAPRPARASRLGELLCRGVRRRGGGDRARGGGGGPEPSADGGALRRAGRAVPHVVPPTPLGREAERGCGRHARGRGVRRAGLPCSPTSSGSALVQTPPRGGVQPQERWVFRGVVCVLPGSLPYGFLEQSVAGRRPHASCLFPAFPRGGRCRLLRLVKHNLPTQTYLTVARAPAAPALCAPLAGGAPKLAALRYRSK